MPTCGSSSTAQAATRPIVGELLGFVLWALILRALYKIARNSTVRESKPGDGTKIKLVRIRRSTSYAARLGRREAQGRNDDWGW